MTPRTISPKARKERMYPLVVSLVLTTSLALLISFTKFYPASESAFSNILSASIDFSAITVGFSVTSLSIIPSLEGKQIIKNLKINKSYSSLIAYLTSSAVTFLILVVFSMAGFLVDFSTPKVWHFWIAIVWIFVFFLACLNYYRAISLFVQVMKEE
jgi:hypothetical protein